MKVGDLGDLGRDKQAVFDYFCESFFQHGHKWLHARAQVCCGERMGMLMGRARLDSMFWFGLRVQSAWDAGRSWPTPYLSFFVEWAKRYWGDVFSFADVCQYALFKRTIVCSLFDYVLFFVYNS